jgi:hypothetical protein
MGLNPGNSSKRQWIYWKQFLMHLVLINSHVPSEADLADLKEKLSAVGEDDLVDKHAFKAVSSFIFLPF